MTELPKCTPSILMENCNHVTCPVLSILFYIPQPIRLFFEKFIFDLEASYSFKITCILVRQVISFIKIVLSLAKLTV